MTRDLAIAIGLIAGLALGLLAAATESDALMGFAQAFAPAGTAFINLVRMVVIPLVATTIFTGVAGLGDPRRLGKLGGTTLAFFWATTFVAILIGMATMWLASPLAPSDFPMPAADDTSRELPTAVDFLLGLIPANPFEVAASGRLLPLIVFMVLFGAATGALPEAQRDPLIAMAHAMTAALVKLVHWILWTAPVGVFALAAPLTAQAGWAVLRSLFVFVAVVAVGLVVFVAVVYVPAAKYLGRTSAATYLRGIVSPVAIGMGSTSSAAALPAMLESARDPLRVSPAVAGLVLSLGAAIGRAGSALFQGAALVFLAALYDVSMSGPVVAAAVLAVFLASLTVAGVPSASLVTLAPALDVAGVPVAGLAVLFGVDRIPDMLRTGVNISGHMATATIVDRVAGHRGPDLPPTHPPEPS